MKVNDNDILWVVTSNIDGEEIQSEWKIKDFKALWNSNNYTGPSGDDEVLTYAINGIIQELSDIPIDKDKYVDFFSLLVYLGIEKYVYNFNSNPKKHSEMEMWLIAAALGEASEGNGYHLIDKMTRNDDGTFPIEFSIGGISLDFSLVAKRIDESLNDMIKNKATNLLLNKYDDLISELEDIKERISYQKDTFFKYEWEK